MRIVLASSIDPGAVSALRADHEVLPAFGASEAELCRQVQGCDVMIFRSGVQISERVLRSAERLALLVRAGSGLDNVDLECAERLKIKVVRVPGSSAQPVAEFTFALLLSVARKVTLADRLLREGRWPKPDLGGPLLTGKTLGVVGAGRIGTRVGEMGAAWGMRVLGCVASPTAEAGIRLRAKGIKLAGFDEVVQESDFLSIHVPLEQETRHLIDDEVLGRMKPGSYLVNLARGGVVDEEALLDHLQRGRTLHGAALDVHEQEGEGTHSPLAGLPNVVLTPHIGAMALDSQRLIGERVVELVKAHRLGQLENVLTADERINRPDVTLREIAS